MIRRILRWPEDSELLAQHSAFVPTGMDIDQLVTDLFETMYAAGGIGLAAIQIGVPFRVFTMDLGDTGRRYVFVNSFVEPVGKYYPMPEGCLSIPGLVESVRRWESVQVTWVDETGKAHAATFKGLEAQVIQHENDHLSGVLLADRVSLERQKEIREELAARKTEESA